MWHRLTRILKPSRRTGIEPYQPATEDDLYYCYRLLLHREPDGAGWRYWKDQIAHGRITLKSLTTSFLTSEDFLRTQLHTGYAELHMAAQELQLVRLDGFQMYIRKGDLIGESIAYLRSYEPHVTRAIEQRLKPGGVFIDIGANIGYFSLLAATLVGPAGRVIAFEPNPQNCLLIRSSITSNAFSNIELHVNAVAEREQAFILEVDGSNGRILAAPDHHDTPGDQAAPFPHCYLVQAVVLDQLLHEIGQVDLIKLDIEGAEPRALQGMTQLLRRYHPTIITELFPSMLMSTSGVEPEAYLNALRQHQYALFVIEPIGVSTDAQSNEQILEAMAQTHGDHLDLLALPLAP